MTTTDEQGVMRAADRVPPASATTRNKPPARCHELSTAQPCPMDWFWRTSVVRQGLICQRSLSLCAKALKYSHFLAAIYGRYYGMSAPSSKCLNSGLCVAQRGPKKEADPNFVASAADFVASAALLGGSFSDGSGRHTLFSKTVSGGRQPIYTHHAPTYCC